MWKDPSAAVVEVSAPQVTMAAGMARWVAASITRPLKSARARAEAARRQMATLRAFMDELFMV
jgi:hypothetical protein